VRPEAVTTDELLDAGAARTQLTRAQLVRMVGKSAAIRHIATHPIYREKFVLKGGSLLAHVYKSPRQSIADADYVHLEPAVITAPELDDAFNVAEGGMTMSALFRYDHPKGFTANATFEISGIELARHDRRSRELKVTISIRPGEWLDQHGDPLTYTDPLLAGDSSFAVQGLSRDELAAEKVLAWCSKDLPKHFVDLAYLKREHDNALDFEKIAGLVRRKFTVEKSDRRYQLLNITRPNQLGARFVDDNRIQRLVHGDWRRLSSDELFFLPHELKRAEDDRLTEATNVERLGLAFWASLAPYLG
jgi:Nucleotidyl transferase AbiEii toxin, Type IV TA system